MEGKDRGMYLAVISSTISAATFYGSTSLIMSSIVGTWLGASSHNIFLMSTNVYGDKSFGLILVKYFSILTCFLVAFASFLLCVRSLVHATYLLSMPNSQVPAEFIQRAVVRGSALWAVGFRAICFGATLLLWIFGPIPMFMFSLVVVLIFSIVDANSTPLEPFRPATKDDQPI